MYRQPMPLSTDQKWSEQKKKLQLKFSNLTDDDLSFETGRKYEMIKRISAKVGKTEAEMKRIFHAL